MRSPSARQSVPTCVRRASASTSDSFAAVDFPEVAALNALRPEPVVEVVLPIEISMNPQQSCAAAAHCQSPQNMLRVCQYSYPNSALTSLTSPLTCPA